MSESKEYFSIGQRVFAAPQGDRPVIEAATPTKEAVLGIAPARPTGTIRGVQHLEDPVSYLVAKDGEAGGEWISEDQLEAITDEQSPGEDAEKAA